MNIAVCLKIISQLQFTDFLGESGNERLKSGQLAVNPADEYALELALRVKDKLPETHITVITMAPQYADTYLRTALAMGADEAVLASDMLFAGSDTLMTSYVLSKALEKLPKQDLILCGKKALDSETGHIAPQIAQRLHIPCAANVLDFTADKDSIIFTRAQDDGIVKLRGNTPLVMSVCNGTGMVRNPSIFGLRKSRNAEIKIFDRKTLGIDENLSGTETVSVTELVFSSRAHTQTDSIEQGTETLLAMLGEEHGV